MLKTNKATLNAGTLASNIVLWNKPLDTIKQYIQGDWKYFKYSGGIAGPGLEVNINNGELLINGDAMKLWEEGHLLTVNNKINWTKSNSSVSNGYTCLMGFGRALDWIVYEIKNDTLTTVEDNIDGLTYYIIKK